MAVCTTSEDAKNLAHVIFTLLLFPMTKKLCDQMSALHELVKFSLPLKICFIRIRSVQWTLTNHVCFYAYLKYFVP